MADPVAGTVIATATITMTFKVKEGEEDQGTALPDVRDISRAVREVVTRWDWLDVAVTGQLAQPPSV